ncbi:general stress protein [Dactylosporangium sp. CA-092794]|uniref:general stress protein n=1 Tax=Dactylosporangium sp. CA-092794 TaxID=3239929 RepID=UPI003D93FF0E
MTSVSQPGGSSFSTSGPAGRVSGPERAANEDRDAARQPRATIATYPDYLEAQHAVDRLSDSGFPVERVTIIGEDLRLVERVLGRLTVGRAALAGAGTGAWFGLLVGFLLGIFAVSAWWKVMVFAIVAGVVWGAVFGAIAHAMTGGRRDFTSTSTLQAGRYSVQVDPDSAPRARHLLTT